MLRARSGEGLVLRRLDAARMEALRPEWEALHRDDPQATVFQSWTWMRGLIDGWPAGTWSLLAARDEAGTLCGLLPLGEAVARTRHGIPLDRCVFTGGRYGDVSGLLCRPGNEREVMEAFAGALAHAVRWDRFDAHDAFDPRLRRFVEGFARPPFAVVPGTRTAVPMVDLPRSWDDYLRDRLSARRREDLRRAMRAIEALPGLRDERAAPDTFEPPFEALMRLRSQRWGLDHDDEMRRLGRVLSRMLAEGAMTLRTFWDGDVLVAGIGGFPDRARGVFWYYLSAFNPDYAKLSPGKAVFGFSIRDAVEAGFRSYSFTYGDEAYKATFGAEDAFCTDMLVLRRSLRSSLVRVLLTTYLRLKRHPNP